MANSSTEPNRSRSSARACRNSAATCRAYAAASFARSFIPVCARAFSMRTFIERAPCVARSEEHTSELQSQSNLVCRLLLEKKNYLLHVDVSADDIHQIAAGADLFDDDQWFGLIAGRQPQVVKGDRGKRTDARIANGDCRVDRRADARQNECLQKECAGQEEIKQHQQQQAAAADPKQKAEPTWLRPFRLRRCPR